MIVDFRGCHILKALGDDISETQWIGASQATQQVSNIFEPPGQVLVFHDVLFQATYFSVELQ